MADEFFCSAAADKLCLSGMVNAICSIMMCGNKRNEKNGFFIRTAGFKKNADYLFDNQRFLGEPLARLELATYALRKLLSIIG